MHDFDNAQNLLENLRLGKNEAFEFLYQKHYRKATTFVKTNTGTETDARDIFQEALLVLFKKTRSEAFVLTAEIGTFLYAVVRRLWLYRLRTSRLHPEVLSDDAGKFSMETSDDFELAETEMIFEQKHIAVKDLMKNLKTECQQLIEGFYYDRLTTSEIAQRLGYTESFVKVKKHRCMESLREKVKSHEAFQQQ